MTAADDQLPEKDQSMDDILASIRRIMLDEQARLQDGPGALAYSATRSTSVRADPVVILDSSMVVEEMPPQRHAPFFSEDTDADVVAEPPEPAAETPVELAELDMTGEEPVPSHAATDVAVIPIVPETVPPVDTTVDSASEHLPVLPDAAARPILISPQAIEALMAPAAAAAAAASMEALLKQLSEERLALVQPSPPRSPTIEEIVRAELRPYLKAWLDEHLPPMVEGLVRIEITRLIGRSGF